MNETLSQKPSPSVTGPCDHVPEADKRQEAAQMKLWIPSAQYLAIWKYGGDQRQEKQIKELQNRKEKSQNPGIMYLWDSKEKWWILSEKWQNMKLILKNL